MNDVKCLCLCIFLSLSLRLSVLPRFIHTQFHTHNLSIHTRTPTPLKSECSCLNGMETCTLVPCTGKYNFTCKISPGSGWICESPRRNINNQNTQRLDVPTNNLSPQTNGSNLLSNTNIHQTGRSAPGFMHPNTWQKGKLI